MSQPHSVQIGAFDATLRDVVLHTGLRIASVNIEGSDLTAARDPFRVSSPEVGNVRIEIHESALTEFVGKIVPAGMTDLVIRLADGLVHLSGVKTVLVPLAVKASCTLKIVDETSVYIELVSVDVAGIGLRQFVQSYIDKINPVVSTSTLPVPARLQRIELAGGVLTLWGTVEIQFDGRF